MALDLQRGTVGRNVMYFETGQGSCLSANALQAQIQAKPCSQWRRKVNATFTLAVRMDNIYSRPIRRIPLLVADIGIGRVSQIDTMRTNTPTCPAAAAAASPVSPPLPACPRLARVRHGGGKSVGLRVAFFRGPLFE